MANDIHFWVYPLSLHGIAMNDDIDNIKDRFFNPKSSFRGDFTPENLAFNANLQEFANRVAIICNLETGGRVSADEAYKQIKQLWKQLKQSKAELLDAPKPPTPELPPE
jgi:hypothetical protein